MKKPFPIALQVYSVREQARKDLAGTLKKIADMGYRGVEFAGLYEQAPSDVRKMVDDAGLQAVSMHGPIPDADNANEIRDQAATLGYPLHMGQFPRKSAESIEGCQALANQYTRATELVKGGNLTIGVHNHEAEFACEHDGKTAHQILLDATPGLVAQIDTYWVKVGGKDPAQVIRALGTHAASIHIKDGPAVRGPSMQPIGQGVMEWGPIVEAIETTPVEWLIVELDRCEIDMLVAVEQSVKYLIDRGYGR